MVGEFSKCVACGRVGCVGEDEQDGDKVLICKCGGERFRDVEIESEGVEGQDRESYISGAVTK